MGNSFRQQPGPALYGENKTPVSEDILEVGILVAFGMIAFSFGLIIIGIRGWEVSRPIALYSRVELYSRTTLWVVSRAIMYPLTVYRMARETTVHVIGTR